MVLSSLLASSKYIIVNKDLIQTLGLYEAILLGELCSEYTYWESTNQLEDNDYFYSTRDNLQKNTGISPHFQRLALKSLEEKEIIFTKKRGIPCKTYYKIDESKIIEYLKIAKLSVVNSIDGKTSTDLITSSKKETNQDDNTIYINNNNINNKKIKKSRANFEEPNYPPGFFDFLFTD